MRRRAIVLLVVTVAALVAVVSAIKALGDANTAFAKVVGKDTPALIDLQFVNDPVHADRILSQWTNDKGHALALASLTADNWLIAAYVAFGLSLLLLTFVIAQPGGGWAWLIALAIVAGGLFDVRENAAMRDLLNAGDLRMEHVHRIRDSAILKFSLLFGGSTGLLILLGGSIRVVLRKRRSVDAFVTDSFAQLAEREADCLFKGGRPRDYPLTEVAAAVDEPRVSFRAADVIGIALSGGGIRSATFNLGLLQGLELRNLLSLFDYLSTVSGGGYIGGFWSDWLARQELKKPPDQPDFPIQVFPGPDGRRARAESPSERHLREFSRFLAPRWGFFEVETWTAIVALLAGLLPALAIGLAVLGLGMLMWLALLMPIAFDPKWHPIGVTLVLFTTAVLIIYERLWFEVKAESSAAFRTEGVRWTRYAVLSALGLLIVIGVHREVSSQLTMRFPQDVWYWHQAEPAARHGLERFWAIAGVFKETRGTNVWVASPRLFEYSITWIASALILILFRLLQPLGLKVSLSGMATYDRVVMRLLGAGVLWAAIAAVWHVVINIDNVTTAVGAYLAAAVASGSAFAALRNWIGVGLRKSDGEGLMTRLKPYLPQVLAYLTLILFGISVGRLLVATGATAWLSWYYSASLLAAIGTLGLFIDPSKFGLHAFYRDRLARAYTGSNNYTASAADNRATDPQDGDDRPLWSMPGRPLHLICCAANDLSGDTVQTLGRGARSAVVSRYGVAVGNHSVDAPDLTLGSAITASAAAFNSNMGMVSKRVGPAVSFLMTMLNLRLGLWVRHPRALRPQVRRWPGLLLYREMFGLTSASGRIDHYNVPKDMRDLHLSDGGHFENTSLYELVRRHCRYILMSDCGADPSAAFSDVGNALRRIREDFGVDISLDIEPIRANPLTGLSAQHVAIGTIHYSGDDRGILLCVKPTMTGDEPPDVRQYKIENSAFPHQTTGDQFYDEAQFESYRRLGLHVAEQVFSFVPPDPIAAPGSGAEEAGVQPPEDAAPAERRRPPTADWVFAEAMHRWGHTPEGLADSVLNMTARFGALEEDLQRAGRADIIHDVFPEYGTIRRATTGGIPIQAKPVDASVANGECDVLFFVRVAQLMEDAWIACRLDHLWNHPLNLGWTNLFARWATSSSFRYWWPVICAMYSPGFVRFMDQRFAILLPPKKKADGTFEEPLIDVPQKGEVEQLVIGEKAPGLTEVWWTKRSSQPHNFDGRVLYQNVVPLRRSDGGHDQIQVGIAAVTQMPLSPFVPAVGWTSDDYFVPPSYWGASFGWNFLNGLLETLDSQGFVNCYVVVKAVQQDAHHRMAIEDHRSFIRQYRKIGFRQLDRADRRTHVPHPSILRRLDYQDGDVLFHMDVQEWARRRGTRSI